MQESIILSKVFRHIARYMIFLGFSRKYAYSYGKGRGAGFQPREQFHVFNWDVLFIIISEIQQTSVKYQCYKLLSKIKIKKREERKENAFTCFLLFSGTTLHGSTSIYFFFPKWNAESASHSISVSISGLSAHRAYDPRKNRQKQARLPQAQSSSTRIRKPNVFYKNNEVLRWNDRNACGCAEVPFVGYMLCSVLPPIAQKPKIK